MDLPIFQENLRSSGGWAGELEREASLWRAAGGDASERARQLQVEHAIARSIDHAPSLAVTFSIASQLVLTWSQTGETNLDLDRLSQLQFALTGASEFRNREAAKLNAYHDPAPATLVPRLIDNALDWFQTPSFGEIHPVEQAAIAHLRILDLQPFATMNEELAHLIASFYVQRAALPPLVLFSGEEDVKKYDGAREAAFRMLTQPLVELLSDSLVRTMRLATA